MSLFDPIPEPRSQPLAACLPAKVDEAVQMRLNVLESIFDGAAKACQSMQESINRGDYAYRSCVLAYADLPEKLDLAAEEFRALTDPFVNSNDPK